jgi:hypothetical protein
LRTHKRGEPRACAMVKAPTSQEEDRRRFCRERKVLIADWVKHVNRIEGLLFAQGYPATSLCTATTVAAGRAPDPQSAGLQHTGSSVASDRFVRGTRRLALVAIRPAVCAASTSGPVAERAARGRVAPDRVSAGHG